MSRRSSALRTDQPDATRPEKLRSEGLRQVVRRGRSERAIDKRAYGVWQTAPPWQAGRREQSVQRATRQLRFSPPRRWIAQQLLPFAVEYRRVAWKSPWPRPAQSPGQELGFSILRYG